MKNPFKYGGVVDLNSFCNRKVELAELRRVFENGDRLFIYSERRVGKTSLIKMALSQLPDDRYLKVYVDLWPTTDEIDLAFRLAVAITEATKHAASAMLDFAKNFFGSMKPAITMETDGTPKVIFGASRGDASPPSLDNVLSSLAGVTEQSKKRIVVIFDEFQQIAEYESDAAERKLRSAIQHHQAISYIFLGSKRHLLEQMFVDKQRPLYRSASHYPLSMIAEQDWIPFIKEKFDTTNKPIETDLIKKLCGFTHGHPFYTQHLSHALWELTDSNTAVMPETLQRALDLLLERESFAYSTLWDSLAANQKILLSAVATQESDDEPFSADFVRISGLRTASNIQRAGQALMRKDLIDRNKNGAFYIPDQFLRLWLRRRI
jgi:hypothetical protein